MGTILRVLYAGLGTAGALVLWGLAVAAIALNDSGGDEQLNGWTAVLVAPVWVTYAVLVVGLAWGGWHVWRWLVPAIVIAGVPSLLAGSTVHEAARAYEPEDLWLVLWIAASPIAAGVVLVGELVLRSPPNRQPARAARSLRSPLPRPREPPADDREARE